jgi:hypothetical protein
LTAPAHLSPTERAEIQTIVDQAFGDGFRWVMIVCALLLFAGATISFVELSPDMRATDHATEAERSGDPPS